MRWWSLEMEKNSPFYIVKCLDKRRSFRVWANATRAADRPSPTQLCDGNQSSSINYNEIMAKLNKLRSTVTNCLRRRIIWFANFPLFSIPSLMMKTFRAEGNYSWSSWFTPKEALIRCIDVNPFPVRLVAGLNVTCAHHNFLPFWNAFNATRLDCLTAHSPILEKTKHQKHLRNLFFNPFLLSTSTDSNSIVFTSR